MKNIKSYELFTEGILDKLKGPTYDDVLKNKTPDELLKFCFNNLDDVGVEYALEHGASEELYDKLVEMKEWFLDLITDLEEVKPYGFPNSILYGKNDKFLFKHDYNSMTLWVDYDKIWSVLTNKYNYNNSDIQLFIKNLVEEELNWEDFTPWSIILTQV